MRRIISTLLVTLALMSAAQNTHAFGVGISPTSNDVAVNSGEVKRQIIKVQNFNPDKSVRLTISATDWQIDEQGDFSLLPPDTIERSASPWVRFSPSVLMLGPNGTATVKVEIATPAVDIEQGDYRTAVVVSTVLPSKEERKQQKGIWNRYQIASVFYVNVADAESDARIDQVAFENINPGQSARLKLDLTNEGLAHARVKGDVRVLDATGNAVTTQTLEAVVLDESSRTAFVDLPLKDLKPGTYKSDLALSVNGKAISIPAQAAELTVE